MKTFVKTFASTILCGVLTLVGSMMNQPLIIILAIIIGGYAQTKEGILDTLEHKSLNVELLMIFSAIGACIIGHYSEGAILIFIFSLSGALEEMTLDRSKRDIQKLMELQPTEATRIHEDGTTEVVNVETLKMGDRFIVAVGGVVPTDGVIVDGASSLEEAAITGEPLPKEKSIGDDVYGGTLNMSQSIIVEVNAELSETLLNQIVRMVEESQKYPSTTARFIDKFEDSFAKLVVIGVILAYLVQVFLLKVPSEAAFYKAMVLLVVASPCALVASATPATLAAVSNGAKRGILVKGGIHFENLMDVKAFVFDKTGTLTEGQPKLVKYGITEDEQKISAAVVALEQRSSHPLAQAIVTGLRQRHPEMTVMEPSEVEEIAGFGIEGRVNGAYYKIGKRDYMVADPSQLMDEAIAYADEGQSLVYVEKDGVVVAYLGLIDVVREGAIQTIAWMNEHNIETIMITGDHQATAEKIGQSLGIKHIIAQALPQDKAKHVQTLKETYGSIAMVGDGINDAPALAEANIGVAMGSGTAIAMEASDVILVKSDLKSLPYAITLSRKLRRVVTQNIVFSMSVIIALVIANFANHVPLPLGVLGHEGSTILVILNGLRLLRPVHLDK